MKPGYFIHSLLWLISLLLVSYSAFGRLRPIASIPFRMSGTYIIVQTSINGGPKLELIFDTGVRHTIITELFEEDSINIQLEKRQAIHGLGEGKSVYALISSNNELSLGKQRLHDKTIYVIEEDIFGLSAQNGRKINGLLGNTIMQDHVVEVNYTANRLRFYLPEEFEPPRNYIACPLLIENNKIYLTMSMLDEHGQRHTIKMLIDSGAQLNAWFKTGKNDHLPEQRVKARIGEGFSGEIRGYLARIPRICLEDFCFKNPIVAFPDSSTIAEIFLNSDRDGTIGSELLARFNYFIDLNKKMLYLKPNGKYKAKFDYNITGIEIIKTSYPLQQFEVVHLWEESPAMKAGIKLNDVLLKINGRDIHKLDLSEVRGMFRRPSRMPLTLLIRRNNQTLELDVDMRDQLAIKDD
ncbi:MAG: aspartyl protease family protein [Bacteroidales bacterium]|jgi:hypothetical protein|nr:aspartyl protease family protein [Bacteroidales bacterium]